MTSHLLHPLESRPNTPSSSSSRRATPTKQKSRPAPYHIRTATSTPEGLALLNSRLHALKTQDLPHSPRASPTSRRPPALSIRTQDSAIQRSVSLPAYGLPLTPSSAQTALEVPFFAPSTAKSTTSPLVFPHEYIETFLQHAAELRSAPPISLSQSSGFDFQQRQLLTPHPNVDFTRASIQRNNSDSLVPPHYQQRLAKDHVHPPTARASIPATWLPQGLSSGNEQNDDVLASTQTTLVGSVPVHRHATFISDEKDQKSQGAEQAEPKSHAQKLQDDKEKQKYAMELIDLSLATLNRVWPETVEAPKLSPARPSIVITSSTPTSSTPPSALPTRPILQQFTPASSPTSTSGLKRKRPDGEPQHDEPLTLKKRATTSEGHSAPLYVGTKFTQQAPPSETPASSASAHSLDSTSSSSSPPITLRLFVRELLRRSKTHCSTLEVALCYLDGIEGTVRRLKDCYKLGMAFGTVAMSERGLYEEGMKDDKRIISLEEAMAEIRGSDNDDTWTPISPESDSERSGDERKAVKTTPPSTTATSTPPANLNLLASHPLLDPRRSFLAALVIATKFLQDRAYSNKAWAKLSGLPAQEIGRCERALGGALGWRVWVGKEFGKPPASPKTGEEAMEMGASSVEAAESGDDVIHGTNDPVAESLLAAAAGVRAQRELAAVQAHIEMVSTLSTPLSAAAGAACLDGWNRSNSWIGQDLTTPLPGSSHQSWLDSGRRSLSTSSCSSAASTTSSITVSHDIEPASLAASLEIINSMLDAADAKDRTCDATVTEASQSTTVMPSSPATGVALGHDCATRSSSTTDVLVPGSTNLSSPPSIKKTPVMGMCGSFMQSSPLHMDAGVPPFPFTFLAAPPSAAQSQQRRPLSPSRTLVAPALLRVATGLLGNGKLSPYGGGSLDSTPHATFSSPAYTIPISTSFLSPNEVDTPPPSMHPHHLQQQQQQPQHSTSSSGHVSRSATLVDAMNASTKYGTCASSASIAWGSYVKHDMNSVGPQAFLSMHSASIPTGHLSSSPAEMISSIQHFAY